MTTMASSSDQRRRLDSASLALLVVGVVSAALSFWLIGMHDLSAVVIFPSIVAVTTGASHITKREAPRR